MNKRKVIITGATSMLGSALIRKYLTQEAEKIYAVIQPGSHNLYRLPKDGRINIIPCDTEKYLYLKDMIHENCDIFFHFAWDGTGVNREKSTIGQSQNIVYTLEAMNTAKELGCSKFIGSGSQAEYGILDISSISENSPTNPVTAYGIAKLAAGQLSLVEAKKKDINCFWVRIFSLYGLYDKPSTMISNAISKFRKGENMSFTPAEQRWDYLYCDDAANAFSLIAEKSEGQKIYCLGSGKTRQLKEYIYTIRDIINPNVTPRIGDIPYKENEVMNMCADITRISKDTGWKPEISFEKGIRLMTEQ